MITFEHTDLVGAYDRRTCVELYIEVDETCCIMAHINAINKYRKLGYEMSPGDRAVTIGEGTQIQDAVLAQSIQEAQMLGWTPVAETKYVVCCPVPASENALVNYTGFFVLEAIRTFLGVAESNFRHEAWGGFIVNHDNAEVVEKFVFDKTHYLARHTPGLDKYEVMVESGSEHWRFENGM